MERQSSSEGLQLQIEEAIVNITYLAFVAALSFCTLRSCVQFTGSGVAARILAFLRVGESGADHYKPSLSCANVE